MKESILKALNQGITEQRWQIVGYGGSWSRAIAPLQQYIERKVRKEVRAAVTAERQRCAQIAREFDREQPNTNYGGFIARLIEGDME
jgi:hypothetical protein